MRPIIFSSKQLIKAAIIAVLAGGASSAQAQAVPVQEVPEPVTLGLLVAGLAGLGVVRWRRK